MDSTKKIRNKEDNLFQVISFRFLPYWPLFVLLLAFCLTSALVYLRYATPIYEAYATLLVKDERKGSDDSKLMESLNIYSSKKIVENEIEVIQSRALLNEVATKLNLYAPITSKGRLHDISAYTSSPIAIQVKDPEQINKHENIEFTYDASSKAVVVGGQRFALGQWVKTPYGELMFSANPKQSRKSTNGPLYFSLYPLKAVVNGMAGSLGVNAANKLSTIVNLQYKDEDPKRAEDILNELVRAYNNAGINDKNSLAVNTLDFVDERLQHVKSELETVERRIQQYRSQSGAVNLGEQSSLFLKNVGDNDQKVASMNMQLAVLDQVEKYVTSGNSKAGIVPSTLGVNDPVLSQLLQRLYDTEIQYEKLKKTTAENNPMLSSLTNEIEKIRPNILENIRIQRISLNAGRDDLNATNRTYASMLQSIPEKERALLEISRQQAIINRVYEFLLQKREETALSYASTVADSRVVDVAQSSLKPVSPKKIIVLGAAIVAAILVTFLVVSFKELLSSKILFRSEIEERTTVPVVAEIANVRSKKKLIIDNPKYQYASEQFRQLRAAIGLYGKNLSKKNILVTSSVSGEGKSFVSANLALSLARSGKKVVLVDLDLRSPKIASMFGIDGKVGVSEFLNGDKEVYEILKKTEYNNLFIATSGEVPTNATELLFNGRLAELFSEFQKSFDFIIADTSPVDPVTDAYILSEYCDTSLYVIRHGHTPKAIVQLLDENNKVKALNNVAIVFNDVRSRGFLKGAYGFGYGYGYEYMYKQKPAVKSII